MIEKSLVMSFANELDKKFTVTVKDIKENVEESTINSIMEYIIENDVFMTSGGSLVSKVSANIISKEVTNFEVK
ncbi:MULTISPECIES: DUF2922 domain-containing protein [Clostridium]|uniref:DUF2922 domain-containing protein n=3 Tax=Clostridium TaxID=1485 RepID=A0A0A7FUR6_9CLOT|nr:DUF2922 domain-containing protein [Clostridium baratii]AIY83288.1 hypothetical protein U729_864 [Clostridium baratii str. Sullivan]MBS6008107.1 DUF2922 domain-containing protein [Clostridium baratii]MBS6042280.1 DUF2922 domain-containing protein [Clostridium baratii]MBT9832073.1 DUF2922 family protein [Clostridium baratii]MDU1055310.1 DUF2922 domain-containing protein [Clostridium baratii]